ncbi:calcium-binding protein [Streptomyces sp. URMC 129]|uniref:calcium-binding protein n=1 Tax=Streptomyces sp. URMC 129 TaxID=3423407 RepID=UPI003F1C62C8
MRKTSTFLSTAVLVAAGALGLATTPAGAAATGATVSGNDAEFPYEFTYTGGDGTNDLVVTVDEAAHVVVFDDVVPIAPGVACFRPDERDPTVAACEVTVSSSSGPGLDIALGLGNDRADIRATSNGDVRGGPGADTLGTGGSPYLLLWGDEGSDTLSGAYEMHGGSGNDTLSLVTGDYAFGDTGDDTIRGGAGADTVYGGAGNDLILAEGARDYVWGNSGRDEIRGGTGNDELHGGPDPDVLYGNSGDDALWGGGGTDTLSGGPGTDTLNAG